MNRIENVYPHCEIFIYDLEFIGDINNLQTCKIWDICVLHVKSKRYLMLLLTQHRVQ